MLDGSSSVAEAILCSSVLSGSGLSKEERQLFAKLLELFRSGAFTSILLANSVGSVGNSASPISASNMSTHVPARSEKQKGVRAPQSKQQHAGTGWKLIHRASDPSVYSNEKLLDNGWSVPIKQSVSELSASEPGVCLATTSEARKAVKELNGDKALAVLSP